MLTIETGNRWLDQQAARERDLASGQYVSLCVSDTGSGMTPEVAARAFDPFFTTKPIGMGTGLGLSMAMVCLYLPRNHGATNGGGDSDTDTAVGSMETPRTKGSKTVLVVEDEAAVRMLVTDVLEKLGYTAIEAADGNAGLKVLQSDVTLDLMITDVGLPGGMNGRHVADAGR